jgi:hypothetical protein
MNRGVLSPRRRLENEKVAEPKETFILYSTNQYGVKGVPP